MVIAIHPLGHMTPEQQHAHLAALQKRWRTDARKDENYNAHRAEVNLAAGNRVLAGGYSREAKLDDRFVLYRGRIVKVESLKAQK